jgi:uncharacterized membrane protein YeaQ/YmgE (transglycosylase-associated protein family)
LAFVATFVTKQRRTILALIGAGLLGKELGWWLAEAVHGTDWPIMITWASAGVAVHLLWTFVGAIAVLLVFRIIPSGKRRA